MGRKGVSKRKPKQSTSNGNNNHGASNVRPGESSSAVQSLVTAKASPLNRGGTNPSNGSNKKSQRGK